jgi:hypothetical protein
MPVETETIESEVKTPEMEECTEMEVNLEEDGA